MKKKVLLGLLIVLIVFSFATMMLFAMGFCNNIKEVYSLDKSDLIYSLLIKQILLYGVFCFINLLSTIISIGLVFLVIKSDNLLKISEKGNLKKEERRKQKKLLQLNAKIEKINKKDDE